MARPGTERPLSRKLRCRCVVPALLTGGRLVLTVGAGFPRRSEAEYALAGVPWAGRFARLDDTVRLWRHLWGGPRFDGAPDMPGRLLPTRPGGPPIWLGGASPSALARAAELYDGWLPYPPDPADYRAGWSTIQAAIQATAHAETPATAQAETPATAQATTKARTEHANPATPQPTADARTGRAMTPALFATVLVADDPAAGRRALGEYAERAYRMPLDTVETIQLLVTGSPAHIAATLDRYVAAGARHLVLRIGALGMPAQRAQLELLPLIRRPARCAL